MSIFDYVTRAAGAWFMGFFPLAEIYIAIPAAMATGLDDYSVVLWCVLGNYTPILLIHYGYDHMMRIEWVQRWMAGLKSEKAQRHLEKYGTWFVFLVTPWTRVWAMGVTANILGMQARPLLLTTFASISIYAITLVLLIRFGSGLF